MLTTRKNISYNKLQSNPVQSLDLHSSGNDIPARKEKRQLSTKIDDHPSSQQQYNYFCSAGKTQSHFESLQVPMRQTSTHIVIQDLLLFNPPPPLIKKQ